MLDTKTWCTVYPHDLSESIFFGRRDFQMAAILGEMLYGWF